MRVLVVKTSSMGDVVHTLPALTDARRARSRPSSSATRPSSACFPVPCVAGASTRSGPGAVGNGTRFVDNCRHTTMTPSLMPRV
jgi:hypothetical protein